MVGSIFPKKNIVLWGSGKPKREFMHVDDMAKATIQILKLSKKKYNEYTEPQMSHINVGTGKDVTILNLAKKIAIAYKLKDFNVVFDKTKPDGTKRKLMDVSKLMKSTRFNRSTAAAICRLAGYGWCQAGARCPEHVPLSFH
ncbi:MAG: NAD-dependent epimerase/dehydratase family protein [Candidatus Puniceispirillaceae bacterium]